MNLTTGKNEWRFQAFVDCPVLYTNKPPCWFHRLMQRLILGFKWTKES